MSRRRTPRLFPLFLLGVSLLVLGGCAQDGAAQPGDGTSSASLQADVFTFYGTWRLSDVVSGGSGLVFALNETVSFDPDGTFTDRTSRSRSETDPIEGRWYLASQGELRLTGASSGIAFLGGSDWRYLFADSGDTLTLARGSLTKELKRISTGVSGN